MNNAGEFSVATPTDRQIVMMRTFDAPRDLVFEAWTKPEHVSQWWDPSGVPLSVCEIDLRPNGSFRWVNIVNGVEFPFTGTYREIVPPERLVFSSNPDSAATLIFSESNGKTTLKITIECKSKEERDAMLQMRVDAGTARTLENLAAYLPRIG